MKAVVYRGKGDIRLEDVPKPKIQGPEDSIVRVTLAAICGSDLHILNGVVKVDPGTIIGHEFVGVVEEVGSQVTTVKPGDRVVGMAAVSCGRCRACLSRQATACENGGSYGCGPGLGNLQGVQAEYARALFSDRTLEKIPDGVTDEQAIFIGDNLTTAYTAVAGVNPNGRGIEPGSVVAIYGAGPVGLSAIAVSRLFGASQIIALDKENYRLDLATRLGADKVINVSEGNPVKAIKGLTDRWGADLVIEAVGSPVSLGSCLASVAIGGTVAVMGVIMQPVEVPFPRLLPRNVTIQTGQGNFIYNKKLMNLVQVGRLDMTPIITHRLSLAEAVKGYEIFEKRLDEVVKVVLRP
ncbi:MAG: zinc-binding dehydrogenase [Smithellaceae bacterium]